MTKRTLFSSAPRALASFLLAALLAVTLLPTASAETALADDAASASPAENAQRVVKVGYMQSEGVLWRNDDGTFEGYTYDYLTRLAQFTGWTYEFIEAPGETDNERASNLLDMLVNGEVDIEGGMAYSTSLAELFEYPDNSYGTAYTALFVPNTNATITQTDLFTRDEISVALYASANKRREELTYFCEQNGIRLTTVDCADAEALAAKTLSGEVDAFLDVDINVHEGFHSVATFSGRPYFFAAPKGQREIVDAIDEAINRINESNPGLQDTLYDQYFMKNKLDYTLMEEELAFARQHATLRVGIVSEKAPVQSFDKTTGELEGASKGILDYLAEHAGLSYEIVSIDHADDLNAAVREANIDLIAGVDSFYQSVDGLALSLTAPYMSASKLLVYNKFVDPDNLKSETLAVPWELVSDEYPDDARVQVYDSIEACLKAVNDGSADYTYSTSYSAPYYMGVNNLNNLLTLPASSQAIEMCFGLVQPADPELLQIINKSIRNLSAAELDSIVYDNSLINQSEQISLFINDHLLEIAIGFISLLVVVILLLVLYLRTRIKAARNVRAENQRFQKLYSLANEQFFEYSVSNDTLLISKPNSERPDPAEADLNSSDAEQPYRIIRNARAALEKNVAPELMAAITSPCSTVTDAPYEPADGQREWLRIVSHFVTDDTGKPLTVIGKITNIDDEVREKLDLSERAHHDGLTGLLNWKTFQERAEQLLSSGGAGALLIVDTDDFKLVNDTYGHLAGDAALKSTAEALRAAFRPNDLVGRLGGDEFAVCVAGCISHDKLVQRCSGIIEHAVSFPDQDGQTRLVTLSIGGVETPQGASISYKTAYQQADRALYCAKAGGKDRFFIEPCRQE